MKRTVIAGTTGLLATVLLAAACSSGGGGTSGGSPQLQPLTVEANDVQSFQKNFNPFSSSANVGTNGLIYEPLLIYAQTKPSKIYPWLASSYAWADGGRTLTFAIRKGVTWSDGKPFSSEDVKFTLDLVKSHATLNTTGLDYTNVAAPTADKVTISFPHTAYTELPYLTQQPIVPEHLWKSVNPVTSTNPTPVGTGPFTLKAFSTQVYSLGKNPHYWQKGKPVVQEVRYPAYTSQAFYSALGENKIDWAGGFVPNIDKLFVSKDRAHNKYWFPPDGMNSLFLNLTEAPFDNVKVRQAIRAALDVGQLSKTGEYGYEQPQSPTGLLVPNWKSYLAPEYADLTYQTDTAKALSLLASAGFHKGPDGIMVDNAGHKMSFTYSVPTGWTDFITDGQLLAAQLKKVGIHVTTHTMSVQAWLAGLHNGKFDMAIAGTVSGTSPYYLYYNLLSSKTTAPVGQSAPSNYQRWKDPATDKLLDTYAHTDDAAVQKQAIQGIEKIMVDQVPVIPILGSANWFEYRTQNWTGWPTAADPYAMPAPYSAPQNELVLLNLKPAKGNG